MTVQTLTMPRLGETMEEGLVVGWLVDVGVAFKRGDPILELETDKTVVEYPALGDGVLQEVLVGAGDRVAVGAAIARAEVANAADWSDGETAAPVAAPAPAPLAEAAPTPAREDGRIRATPLARRMARTKGVALDAVQGTGRRGRIERADVERSATAGTDITLVHDIQGSGGRMHLLIHGFAGDRSAWAATASQLRRAGHSTATIDLPGHGDTGAEATDLAAMIDAVAAFAATLPGPLVLVGHSMGAAVAVAVAARLGDTVSGLVLLTPAGCGPRIDPEFVHGMARAKAAGEVAHLLRLLGPKGGAVSGAALDQMAAQMARGRLRRLAKTLTSRKGRQRIDLIGPLSSLPATLPVRAIFGLEDGIVSAKDAMNMPPRVAVHFLTTGHMPQWDAPTDVVNLILKGTPDV